MPRTTKKKKRESVLEIAERFYNITAGRHLRDLTPDELDQVNCDHTNLVTTLLREQNDLLLTHNATLDEHEALLREYIALLREWAAPLDGHIGLHQQRLTRKPS